MKLSCCNTSGRILPFRNGLLVNIMFCPKIISIDVMNEILELYDAEVRANPTSRSGLQVVHDADVTRLDGVFNFICSWKFSDDTAQQAVSKQANHFRQLGEELMWRVHDYDKPSNIEACLEKEGFVPSPQGSLMVLPLADSQPTETGHDIRRVTSPTALRDYLAVDASAFGSVDEGDFDYFLQLLSGPNLVLFCGYFGDVPVASGRIEMSLNSSFGHLFGGGVSPSHRGKGFYRALVNARASIAREKGLKYLITEAGEMSRPILEKLGFITLAKERIWLLPINTKVANIQEH